MPPSRRPQPSTAAARRLRSGRPSARAARHAFHRPGRKGRIAGEGRGQAESGGGAHDQSRRGPAVTAVDRPCGGAPFLRRPAATRRPAVRPSHRMLRLPAWWLKRRRPPASPDIRVSPCASAPKINARCEQLLVAGNIGAAVQRPGSRGAKLHAALMAMKVAEREGFEPSIRFCRILTFQASAFDHSATAPHALEGRAL